MQNCFDNDNVWPMVWIWSGFILLVILLLAIDLGVLNRKDHVIGVREALKWSGLWVSLAILFSIFIYFAYENHWMGLGTHATEEYPNGMAGHQAAILYFLGYIIEESLSIDNVFVMAVIFRYFGIPAKYQHRVLFWGIIGAVAMRGLMIGVGAALIQRFEWIMYIFGAFLLFTAYRMLQSKEKSNPADNAIMRWVQKWLPITHEYHGHAFLVHSSQVGKGEKATTNATDPAHHARLASARWVLTPLALALVVIETTDVLFAVDSIPAILGITTDPFIVFTSNVFAILGLRALYFALAGIMDRFRYLQTALATILGVIGLKMLLKHYLPAIPGMPFYLLGLVVLILLVAIIASWYASKRENAAASSHTE